MDECFSFCICEHIPREHTIQIVNFEEKITIQPTERPPQERTEEWKERPFNKILVVMPPLSKAYPGDEVSPIVFDPKYRNPFKDQPAILNAPRLSSMQLDGEPVASSDPGPARGVAEYLALMRMTVANQNYATNRPDEGAPADNMPAEQLPEDQASGSRKSSRGPEHGQPVPPGSGLGRRPQDLELVNLPRQDRGSQQTKTKGPDCAETNV